MALSSSVLSSLIQSNMQSAGAKGSNLQNFCSSIAAGIVMSIVGKSFSTIDTGLTPGLGSGTGIGVQGLSSSIMQSTALSLMSSKGENAAPMIQAIMDAVVTHLSSAASLSTVDTPVFEGTGTVTVGSIAVSSSEMGSNIDSQLQSAGANGSNRSALANVIASGICTNILTSGTGTVTITGTITTPPPVSGSGTGIGTIA